MTPNELDELNQGLIIDNFAGGGGASTGIEEALGRYVDYAINHDPDSIAMHKANHPFTIHLCEDVFKVNPVKLVAGRPVLLAWFSPDCKHFSKAKGGKPADKHIRGLAWVAIKWAKTVKPRIIMLENVEEFQTWGPLGDDGRPIKEKMGTTFHKFVSELKNLGYQVDFRELIAADYGAPTKRKRFFMLARCDGQPICWPEKTFAERGKCKEGQKPWRSAASIIDFSLPTKSIFKREKELAEPTKRRIGRGLEKFVLKSSDPFIIPIGYGENKGQAPRVNDIHDPLMTVVSSTKQNVVQPKIAPFVADYKFSNSGSRTDYPFPTETAVRSHYDVEGKLLPYVAMIGESGFQKFRDGSVKDPVKTIVSKNESLLCSTFVAPFMGVNNFSDAGRRIDQPLKTVVQSNKEVYLAPLLCPWIAINNFKNAGTDSSKPMPVITTAKDKNVLMTAFLSQNYGGDYKGNGSDPRHPTPTITAIDHNRLVTADLKSGFFTEYYGQSDAASIKDPVPTATMKDRFGFVNVDLAKADSGFIQEYYSGTYKGNGTGLKDPVPTATVQPRFGLVKVHLEKATDSPTLGNWPLVREFINKYTNVRVPDGEILLLNIQGKDYFISDIGMRMLTPRELYDAQGFPHDYIIDKDYTGKQYPATKQVARCGNAVPPPFAEALVRANLPELCPKKKITTMESLKEAQKRYQRNRVPFNGVEANGQLSLFSPFDVLSKQVAEERKG